MFDLQLDSGGDIAVTTFDLSLTGSADQVAQRLRTRLRLFLGEWFLDLDAGVPWFDEILGKHLDLRRTEAILRHEILSTPEVLDIIDFSVEYDPKARALTVSFKVNTAFGTASFQGSVP